MKNIPPLIAIQQHVNNFLLSVANNLMKINEPKILPVDGIEPKIPYSESDKFKSFATIFFDEERTPLSPLITIDKQTKVRKIIKRKTRDN